MPELPEVETIKNVLKPHLIGRKISAVKVYNEAVIACPSAEVFAARLQCQTFTDFTRRGKFLTFHFASGDSVVLHLRMTGCLTIEPSETPCERHTHVIFALDDGKQLRYEDTRRFGKFWFIKNREVDTFSGKAKLGIEPFDVTPDYLKEKFKNSKKTLKQLLLDQSVIAGIGNIYSDEICFATNILPDKKGYSLTESEIERLCEAISEYITYFIEKNKITFDEYILTKGKEYKNTPYLQVYGKANEPCPVCGKTLLSKKIGGRSCVYCPECQK